MVALANLLRRKTCAGHVAKTRVLMRAGIDGWGTLASGSEPGSGQEARAGMEWLYGRGASGLAFGPINYQGYRRSRASRESKSTREVRSRLRGVTDTTQSTASAWMSESGSSVSAWKPIL